MHVSYDMHLFLFQKESEGSVTLYYELYIDSLFFTDFIMNFFLLCLTNKMQGRTATGPRCIAGAACGAGIYCAVFIIPVLSLSVRLAIGLVVSLLGMVQVTFKCKGIRQIIKMTPPIAGAMLFLGGGFLLLKEKTAFIGGIKGGFISTLLLGLIAYVLGGIVLKKIKRSPQTFCEVILETECEKIKVNALIDTGNLLIEPISKKPVSVLDENSIKRLFGGVLPQYYRVVPYTSIGRKNGILKCFEIPKISVVFRDEEKFYEKVLIACGEELDTSESYMILNPRLISKEE